MENHLNILSESLDKKIRVLKEIQKYNEVQEASFQDNKVNLEDFDKAVEQKGILIEKLNKLDEGFEILYENLAEQLKDNKERYASQIADLQKKIKLVTELGVSIQAQEKRNKALVEQFFAKERRGIRQGRQSSKAAYGYYQNMSRSNYVSPQFMDSKQ